MLSSNGSSTHGVRYLIRMIPSWTILLWFLPSCFTPNSPSSVAAAAIRRLQNLQDRQLCQVHHCFSLLWGGMGRRLYYAWSGWSGEDTWSGWRGEEALLHMVWLEWGGGCTTHGLVGVGRRLYYTWIWLKITRHPELSILTYLTLMYKGILTYIRCTADRYILP